MKHQQRQEDILFSVCIFFGASDIAENAWVLLWYCFGCLKRICSKFRFYLSLLYFGFFRRRKYIIRYNYAACCRFHQYVEQ